MEVFFCLRFVENSLRASSRIMAVHVASLVSSGKRPNELFPPVD